MYPFWGTFEETPRIIKLQTKTIIVSLYHQEKHLLSQSFCLKNTSF